MWQLQHLSIKSAQCSVKWKHNKMHKIQSDLGKSSSDLPLTIKQTSKHAGKQGIQSEPSPVGACFICTHTSLF